MRADQLADILARAVDQSGAEIHVEGAIRRYPPEVGYRFQVGTPDTAFIVYIEETDEDPE